MKYFLAIKKQLEENERRQKERNKRPERRVTLGIIPSDKELNPKKKSPLGLPP